MKKIFTWLLRTTLSLLPPDAPQWIYTKLLRPKPLRMIANACLRTIIPATIQIPEGILCLNPHDPVVSGALVLGAYEPYFAQEFRRHIPKDGVVVDIGANLGYYTLIASQHAKMVLAFEPEKENSALLQRTMALNHCTNVRVIEKGLGSIEGTLPLALDPDNKGKHTLLPGEGTSQMVSITTLDRWLATEDIDHVGLIKMDIEGWEAHAMRGMEKTLRSMPVLFFEFAPARISASGESAVQMLETLRASGYALMAIDEGAHALRPIKNIPMFVSTFTDKESYVNILAKNSSPSPQ